MGSTLDRRTTPRQCSRGVAQDVRQGSLGRWPLARARTRLLVFGRAGNLAGHWSHRVDGRISKML